MKYTHSIEEKLISDISDIICREINEAYILESYGINESLDDIMSNASDKTKTVYKKLKSVIAIAIQELNKNKEYSKAEKVASELKNRIQKYVKSHGKINANTLLRIVVTVIMLYCSVAALNKCRAPLRDINNDIKAEIVVKNKTPFETLSSDTDYQFSSSEDAHEFIKKHEQLRLYPYYASESEQKQGKVTIGYGHVVMKQDGEIYNKIQKLKKEGKIKISYIKKNGKTYINPDHCENIISEKEADKLFLSDIKDAEGKAYRTIKNMNINKDVKAFMLYNQGIIDGFTSLCYNMGMIKQSKFSFITKGLQNCRYDFENNQINNGDYNTTFVMYKNIKDNNSRRVEEYMKFFVNANVPFTNK